MSKGRIQSLGRKTRRAHPIESHSNKFLGLSLSGGKTDKSCIAVIEYYPEHKKTFLARLFDKIKNERYFDGVKKILNTFDLPVFESIKDSVIDTKIYILKADGAEARAQLLDGGNLNVLAGSTARIRETEAFWGWSQNTRKQFVQDGTFIEKGDNISYILTKDFIFNSPSAAAATMTGRPINGWTAWKDEQGSTLDDNLRK